jgi:hypothetical protein
MDTAKFASKMYAVAQEELAKSSIPNMEITGEGDQTSVRETGTSTARQFDEIELRALCVAVAAAVKDSMTTWKVHVDTRTHNVLSGGSTVKGTGEGTVS